MSQVIDEKVVEMSFDNSNFDKNVNDSLSTLEKLKKSLDLSDSAKTFNEVSKAASNVSFEGLTKGIETAKDNMSGFEEIATGALRKIGEKATEVGFNIVKSLSTDLISAGISQYDEKTKSVQTIMNATGESIDQVDSRLEKLIWYADETSYSFTDMVNNVGKFTAAGVDIDKATDSMMGISNWAAVSGAGIQQASRAMYNLSQAMGLGAVTTMDWKSIELANMATKEFKQTVIDTAKEMGKLDSKSRTLGKGTEVTVENFRNTLNEKWFDNDLLTEVLSKYSEFSNLVYEEVQRSGGTCADAMEKVAKELGLSYDELAVKAFTAAQEARTFTEAVEATSDAVKSKWADLFENIFGNYEYAKKLWTNLANTLWEIFAGPLDNINSLFEEALGGNVLDAGDWLEILEGMRDSSDETKKTTEKYIRTFREAIIQTARANGVAIDELIDKYGSFQDSLKEGWLTSDILKETVQNIEDGTFSAGASLEEVADVVHRVWAGEFGNIDTGRFEKLKELGWDPEEIQALVNKGADYVLTIDDLSDAMLMNLGIAEDEIDAFRDWVATVGDVDSALDQWTKKQSGRDVLSSGLNNIVDALGAYATAAGEAFASVFGTLESGDIRNLIDRIHEFSEKLLEEDRIERFKTIVTNIATVLHTVFETLKGIWTVLKAVFSSTLGPVLNGLFKIVGSILNGIFGLFKQLDGSDGYFSSFGKAAEWITETLKPFGEAVNRISEAIAGLIDAIFAGDNVWDVFKNSIESVVSFFGGKDSKTAFGSSSVTKLKTFFTNVETLAKNLGDTFSNLRDKLKDALDAFKETDLYKTLSGYFEKLKDAFSSLWESFSKWVKDTFTFGSDGEGFDFFGSSDNLLSRFNNWLDNIDLKTKINNISDAVLGLKDKIKGFFTGGDDEDSKNSIFGSSSDSFWSKTKNKLKELGNSISFPKINSEFSLTSILENLKNILNWIVEHAPSWRDILNTLATALGGGALVSIIGSLVSIWKVLHGVSGFTKNITGIFNGVKKALNGFAFKQFSEGLLQISAAFLVLAGAMFVLSLIDSDKLVTIGNVLGGLMIIVGSFTALIMKMSSTLNLSKAKLVGTKGATEAKLETVKGVNAFKEGIVGMLKSVGQGIEKWLTVSAYSSAILKVAIALLAVAGAIAILANIKWPNITVAVIAMSAMLGVIGLFIKKTASFQNLGISKKGIFYNGTKNSGIIGIALGMLAFCGVIALLSKYEPETLLKSVLAIGAILVEIGIFQRISKGNGSFTQGMGVIAMAVGMLIIAAVVRKLGEMGTGTLAKGVAAVGVLLLFVSAATRLMQTFKGKDIATAAVLVGLAIAVKMLAGVVKELSKMSFGDLLSGLIGLAGAVVVLALGIKLLSMASSGSVGLGVTLLGIAGIIAAIALAIWAVSVALDAIDIDKLKEKLPELLTALAESLMQAIVGSADSMIQAFMSLLDILLTYAPQIIDKLIDLFIMVLDGLTARMPDLSSHIADFVKEFISEFSKAFADVDLTSVIAAIVALLGSTEAINLIGKFGSFGALTKGIGMVAEVIGAFGLIITALAGLSELLSGGDQEAAVEFLENGSELLTVIGGAIGGFIGGLVGGAIGGFTAMLVAGVEYATSFLPSMATNLSDFMSNMGPFIDGAKNIDSDLITNIQDLAGAILILSGTELMDSIVTFVEKWLGIKIEDENGNKYADNFVAVADAIIAFQDTLTNGEIDMDKLSKASEAANLVTEIMSLKWPEQTDYDLFTRFLNGCYKLEIESSWDMMVEETVSYAKAIVDFCNKIDENIDVIDKDALQKAKDAADMIISITSLAWPKPTATDSLYNFFWGLNNPTGTYEASWDTMVDQVVSYATAIFDFCNKINENIDIIDQGNLETAKTAADMIISITDMAWPEPTATDSLYNFFWGLNNPTGTYEASWDTMVEQVVAYASAIFDFCRKINEDVDIIDKKSLVSAKVAATMITDIAAMSWPENTDNLDSIYNFIAGFKDPTSTYMTSWEETVETTISYADAIVGFCKKINEDDNMDAINNIDVDRVSTVASLISDVCNISWPESSLKDSIINYINGFFEVDPLPNSWNDIKEDVVSKADAIVGFCEILNDHTEDLQNVDTESVAKIAGLISQVMDIKWPEIGLKDNIIDYLNAFFDVDPLNNSWDNIKEDVTTKAKAIVGFCEIIGADDFTWLTPEQLENAYLVADVMSMILALKWPTLSGEDSFANFVTGLIGINVGDSTSQTSNKITSLGTAIASFATNIASVNNLEDLVIAGEFIQSLSNLASVGVASDAGNYVSSNFNKYLENMEDFLDEILLFVEYVRDYLSDEETLSLLNSVSEIMSTMFYIMNPDTGDVTFKSTASDGIGNYTEGLEENSETVLEAGREITKGLTEEMTDTSEYQSASFFNMVAFGGGMAARSAYLCAIATAIIKKLGGYFDKYNDYYKIGKHLIEGIEKGMLNEAESLYALIDVIANESLIIWRKDLGIKSPSKPMIEDGRYIMLGLAKGINDNMYVVDDAATESAQETINVMSDILSGINFDDLDNAPTIRPVLDLTEIQNGAGTISSLLDTDTTIGLSTLATNRLASAIGTTGYSTFNSVYNDGNVIQTINNLTNKVDSLSGTIRGMQVVINGKKLVGAIAGDMETELSGRVYKQQRGVM